METATTENWWTPPAGAGVPSCGSVLSGFPTYVGTEGLMRECILAPRRPLVF